MPAYMTAPAPSLKLHVPGRDNLRFKQLYTVK